VPSKGWAEMIRKVYKTDPFLYPSCGGRMSIISFIDDHKVIDRIIRHLELTFKAERPPPNPRDFNLQITSNLSHVMLKCMEKNRDERYQSAEELFNELSKIEKKIPTHEKAIPKKKPIARQKRRRKRLQFILWPGIIFVAIVMILGYVFLNRISRTGGMRWKNSIAVLPFVDRSQSGNHEPLCEDMTINLITNLSSCEGLKVIPNRSDSRYGDQAKSNKEIGEELGVKKILVPYLKIEGEKIQIMAQLVNASQNFVIHTFEIASDMENIFGL
jgi:TolB-like protein